MAALHTALQSLGPADFSSVPTEESKTKEYLQDLFTQAQVIIDSVPPPPPEAASTTPARSRSNTTTSTVTCASDLSASSARSDPIDSANLALQKEWSKPIKLGAKENPLGMSVYKLGGKDGRGAWFARRSVHEGMGFRKWKLGLQREFAETMEVQGGPGEGNIRGIGGERRVEKISVDGVGTVEVYHLSAQFPGPTTPRDFVTMLVTSSSALEVPSTSQETEVTKANIASRHFMVISKPCVHPDCPPRDGFIRGQYESVEFIREIPAKLTKSSSTTDLLRHLPRSDTAPVAEKAALVQSAQRTLEKGGSGQEMLDSMDVNGHAPLAKEILVHEGRKRGKTISFAESRGFRAKGEALDTPHDDFDDPAEQNAVEWVMITRSDPGGSVPRFMVERGTPSGIVSDASKFLDWACKKEHPVKDDYGEKATEIDHEIERKTSHAEALEQYQTNKRLAGLHEIPGSVESSMTLTDEHAAKLDGIAHEAPQQEGLMSTLTSAAVTGIETYAPQAVIDRLPGHRPKDTSSSWLSNNPGNPVASNGPKATAEAASIASTSDAASFASAEDHFAEDDNDASSASTKSASKVSPSVIRQDRELARLVERRKALDQKLTQTKAKESKDKEELTPKEEDRIRKAEEKHAREVAKHEQRYQKEVAKIEAKRVKDELKEAERKKKAEERDEKVKLTRERDVARLELENTKLERELLKEQVGALQKENTALVAKVGKLEMGKQVLGEVKAEIESGGRSRSSSMKRKKGESAAEGGVEATVLGGAT
ncbi:MAG: hypothetical protein LQ348_005253 [Seirophora lacunosa]|nr:MAG: hypothetical protein LQ348_005253 [Seirophora lacunosa]